MTMWWTPMGDIVAWMFVIMGIYLIALGVEKVIRWLFK